MYRIYGHAFDAMKTMVVDDGVGIFKRLEEDLGGPLPILSDEVRRCCCGVCLVVWLEGALYHMRTDCDKLKEHV